MVLGPTSNILHQMLRSIGTCTSSREFTNKGVGRQEFSLFYLRKYNIRSACYYQSLHHEIVNPLVIFIPLYSASVRFHFVSIIMTYDSLLGSTAEAIRLYPALKIKTTT